MRGNQPTDKSTTYDEQLTASSSTNTVSSSAIYEVLAEPYRRKALQYLQNCPDHEVSLEQLAETLCEDLSDCIHPDRAALKLHHKHLPKLEEQGLLEYNLKNRVIQFHPSPEVRVLLDQLEDNTNHSP